MAHAHASEGKRRRSVLPSDSDDDDEGCTTLGARMRLLASSTPAPTAPACAVAHTPRAPAPPVELPVAVLCDILRLACADGAVPTAARAACVCRAWRAAVALAGAALWDVADLSFGWCRPSDAIITRLCTRGVWAKLRTLSLAGCGRLTDASLHAIAAHCPQLCSLDLSDCGAFSAGAVLCLAGAPRRLQTLNLARASLRPAGAFEASVRSLLLAAAPCLERLSLAGCVRVTTSTLRSLPICCQLRSLDLTSAGSARGVAVPLAALQAACPQLEELRLSGLGLDRGFTLASSATHTGGFSRLRVCELASGTRMTSFGAVASDSTVDDAALLRVLGHSVELRALALGGTRVTAAGLASLPAVSLQRLLLEHCGAACDEGARIAAERWGASLQEVSFAGGGVTDEAAFALAHCPQLHTCDLSATLVSNVGVRTLLSNVRTLRALTLASCRALERPVRLAALNGVVDLRAALGLPPP